MEVLIKAPNSFNSCSLSKNTITDDFQYEIFNNGSRDDSDVLRFNESLNIVVNTIERYKIPKEMKSNISISLPNIFLSRAFDDSKRCNSEKRVQWNHKQSFRFELLKNAFRDTYNYWCHKKRSQSIPNLYRHSNEYFLSMSPEFSNYDTKPNIVSAGQPHIHINQDISENSCNLLKTNKFGEENKIKSIDDNVSFNDNVETNPHKNVKSLTRKRGRPRKVAVIENYSTNVGYEPSIGSSMTYSMKSNVPFAGNPPETSKTHQGKNVTDVNINNPLLTRKRGRPKKVQENFKIQIVPQIKKEITHIENNVETSFLIEQFDTKDLDKEDQYRTSVPSILKNDIPLVIEITEATVGVNKENISQKPPQRNYDVSGDIIEQISRIDEKVEAIEPLYNDVVRQKQNCDKIDDKVVSKVGSGDTGTIISDTTLSNRSEMMELSPKSTENSDYRSIERSNEQCKKHFTYLNPVRNSSVKNNENIKDTQTCSNDDIEKGLQKAEHKKVFDFNVHLKSKKESKIIASSNELKEESKIKKDKPVDSHNHLKRPKRESALNGYANMVATSLNDSFQKHETFDKLSFKQPCKADISNLKSQQTEPISKFYETDCSINVRKTATLSTKKQKIRQGKLCDSPASSEDTIISNCSSSSDSMKYRKIRTNTYIDPRPAHWSQEVENCGCKTSKLRHLYEEIDKSKKVTTGTKKSTSDIVWDCTENCLNRLTYTECNSKTCQCRELCNNQKIRKLEWVNGLKVTNIEYKGRGVLTTKLIRDGTLITEYVGEVIGEKTFQYRMINLYKEDAHHYCLHLDGEMLIDAYRSGSVARFVNHSCQPNCEMQKWMVNGAYRMCLFAIENIEPGTELTYDYNFCSFNMKNTQVCLCGAPNCRGFIGGRPRAEQSESQKDRRKLFYVFGATMTIKEKLLAIRSAIFLIRCRTSGRCKRLGIPRPKQTHGSKLPSTITEIKRRKAKKNQFLTQMSALNSVRSIRTRQLQSAQENEILTRTAQLAQVLRDLYNTLLEQKCPLIADQQLVAPFINSLKQKKYPEFYRMVTPDSIVSLNQVYSRLLDGKYSTMIAFDQDILQMLNNFERYAGNISNIGKCIEQIKPIYKNLKENAIALYEALSDEIVDETDRNCLLENKIIQSSKNSVTNQIDCNSQSKSKRRKQSSTSSTGCIKNRLEHGAEVIKCVCGYLVEAGHVMVQCDRCFVWQHAYCMNIVRAAELIDITNLDPYYCHICLNIPPESLVREIPRQIDILHQTDSEFFWTLMTTDGSMLKIDDFVYIPSDVEYCSVQVKSKVADLSQRTIMRIYNLWKDPSGQRWMEGGLFLRPYNSYFKTLSESKSDVSELSSNPTFDRSTDKWHQRELIYTDLTRILPLADCVGRCNVLNSHTFRLGKPLLQNSCGNDDVYLCHWIINSIGEKKEIDSEYLRINTEAYCFERFDTGTRVAGEDNCLYVADDLLKFDQGSLELYNNKNFKMHCGLNEDEKIIMKRERFAKLVTKLAEFAFERIRKLPLTPPSSICSRSTASSRGTSPLNETVGSKSPIILNDERFPHCQRKQLLPKKIVQNLGIEPSQETSEISKTPTMEIHESKSKSMSKKRTLNKAKRKMVLKKSVSEESLKKVKINGNSSVYIKERNVENLSNYLPKNRDERPSLPLPEDIKLANTISGKCTSRISESSHIILSTVNRSFPITAANNFKSIENISSN